MLNNVRGIMTAYALAMANAWCFAMELSVSIMVKLVLRRDHYDAKPVVALDWILQ